MGILDYDKNGQFTPQQYGLLQAGLAMMANSRGKSFGEALGAGGLVGMQGMQDQQEVMQKQQTLQALQAKQQLELARQQALNSIDPKRLNDPEYRQDMMLKLGMTKELMQQYMPDKPSTPQYFDQGSEPGTLKPKIIDLGNGQKMSSVDFLLQQKAQQAQIPSYGEPERLKLAYEDQALQRAAAARADAQLGLSAQAAQRAEQAAIRQEQAAQEAKLQNIPPTHRMAYAENESALSKINDTIKQVKANPKAFGMQNVFGDSISQRVDPEGVTARSAVAEIGGVKMHDLSGAAVSPTESKRLMPLIPTATDRADAIVKKLESLKREYLGINGEIEKMYSTPEYRNPIKPKQQEKPTGKVKFLGFE